MPHKTASSQVVSGARIVIYLGLLRKNFSAYFSITSSPLEACKNAEQVTTAIIVSITSTGGLPGFRPITKIKKTRPIPEIVARPIPPRRTPITRQAIKTIKPKNINIKTPPRNKIIIKNISNDVKVYRLK